MSSHTDPGFINFTREKNGFSWLSGAYSIDRWSLTAILKFAQLANRGDQMFALDIDVVRMAPHVSSSGVVFSLVSAQVRGLYQFDDDAFFLVEIEDGSEFVLRWIALMEAVNLQTSEQ